MSVTESPNSAEDADLTPDPDADIVFSEVDADAAPTAEMPVGSEPVASPSDAAQAGHGMALEPQPDPAAIPAGASPGNSGDGLNAVLQIPIVVEIVLGTARMTVSELAALGKGSKIPLDRKVGEPVDVVVNGRVIAHGSVVMLDDGTDRFGINLESLAGQESKGAQGAARSA